MNDLEGMNGSEKKEETFWGGGGAGLGLGYMFLLKALKVAQKLGALSSLGGICCC